MRNSRIIVSLFALLALTGCLSHIPDRGSVSYGAQAYAPSSQNFVRTLVSAPTVGATPQELIREFLAATAGDQGEFTTSRLYLAPEVRYTWRPQVEVRIYSGRLQSNYVHTPQELNILRLFGSKVATIDGQGHYQRAGAGTDLDEVFSLRQVAGEWRIASLSDGLALSQADVARSYRQLNVYFLNSSKRTLVPDPVYLPVNLGVSTALISALLTGPTKWLSPAVTTAIPFATTLLAGSVPIQQGVATVDLSSPSVTISTSDREALSAQIVWTLKQLAEVAAVRITIGRVPLIVAGSGQAQSRFSYSNFSPDVLTNVIPSFVIDDQGLNRVSDPLSKPATTLVKSEKNYVISQFRAAAVSLDSKSLAGISQANSLVSGPLTGPFDLRAVGAPSDYWLPPSWDSDGNLWAARTTLKHTGVYLITPNGRTVQVEAESLANRTVQGFRISRDGSRVAYAIEDGDSSRLFLARVITDASENNPKFRIEEPIELPFTAGPIALINWADATDLAILTSGSLRSIWKVAIDGSTQINLAGIVNPVVLAAAPGMPVLAVDGHGTLFALFGQSWFAVGKGRYPIYPG